MTISKNQRNILISLVIITIAVLLIELPNLVDRLIISKQQSVSLVETAEAAWDCPNVSFGTHPNIFLNQCEIEKIKQKITNSDEPWKTAYQVVFDSNGIYANNPEYGGINWAMGVADGSVLPSVTNGGLIAECSEEPIHDYCTALFRPSDNETERVQKRYDYTQGMIMGRAVRTLGLAYALTGNSIYADKAIKLIKNWTGDNDKKMNPRFTTYSSHTEIPLFISAMFDGADLIYNYPGFQSDDKTALKNWAKDLATNAKNNWPCYTTSCDNPANSNYGDYRMGGMRLLTIASGAALADDSDLLQYTFDFWKNPFLNLEIDSDGKQLNAFRSHRSRSLSYSMFGLHIKMQIAEIARHQGEDLYNYRLSDGRGLELALDFLNHPTNTDRKFLTDQDLKKTNLIPCVPLTASGSPLCKTWATRWFVAGYMQCCGGIDCDSTKCNNPQTLLGALYIGQDVGAYEYAYSWKQKQNWLDVINKWQRPIIDNRFGYITLTHAYRGPATPTSNNTKNNTKFDRRI